MNLVLVTAYGAWTHCMTPLPCPFTRSLTSVSESPLAEGVIYASSDDGLVHVTPDGGGTVAENRRALPGVPERTFINNIEASLSNPEGVFVVADAHKVGDYSPYVFASTNKGRSWQSISGDLPDGTIVWAIQQDHENENHPVPRHRIWRIFHA